MIIWNPISERIIVIVLFVGSKVHLKRIATRAITYKMPATCELPYRNVLFVEPLSVFAVHQKLAET